MNDKQLYRTNQLMSLVDDYTNNGNYQYKVKVKNEIGETKWLNISLFEFYDIVESLNTNDHKKYGNI